jgi:hypothetical protein
VARLGHGAVAKQTGIGEDNDGNPLRLFLGDDENSEPSKEINFGSASLGTVPRSVRTDYPVYTAALCATVHNIISSLYSCFT